MDTPLKNHPGRSTPHRRQHLQGRHPADLANRRALVKRSEAPKRHGRKKNDGNNDGVYHWFYMVLYGFIWFYMVLYDFIWFYMVLYGFIWFYMVLYGFI